MIIGMFKRSAWRAGRTPRTSALRAVFSAALCLLAAAELSAQPAPGEESWRLLRSEDGITSWESERPGEPLSALRARALLAGGPWQAVAILEDVGRACEWTSHCAEMRMLRRLSERELLVYARMAAPWPVRDRDVVVSVSVQYGPAGELTLAIASTDAPERPPAAGVVRMPRFRAHYRFALGAGESTAVEYQIELDPGGTLPDWLKRMIARDLAHDTLADLRTRLAWASQRGLYRERAAWLEARARAGGFHLPGGEAADVSADAALRRARAER